MSEWTMKKFLEDNDEKFHDEIKQLKEEITSYITKNKELEATIKKLNDRITDLGWQLDSARNTNQWGA